jgi:phosphonate transport system substrate-binding protein
MRKALILSAARSRSARGGDSLRQARPSISLANVLVIVLPAAIVGLGAYWWSTRLETKAQEELASSVFSRILSTNAAAADGSMAHADKDGDLVADTPDDPSELITPEVLVFSYVASEIESIKQDAWQPLIARIAEQTGREVNYVHHGSTDEQLKAFRNGELHIVGLNTGAVPLAVKRDGFVPLCTFGRDDGSYGYTMKALVPADSSIKTLADVKGHKLTFTRPDSNSGCKALLVLLRDEYGLQPDRDYTWGFSLSHEDSIKGVATKDVQVAPVASDILSRMVEKGEVDPQSFRSIYESKPFPPATIGIAYNLAPELRDAIRQALIGFDLRGTGLEGEYGADVTKLVPVNYEKDWASARHIDQLAAQSRKGDSS